MSTTVTHADCIAVCDIPVCEVPSLYMIYCDTFVETERRLRRDLRRTKSLLTDAQTMMEKQKEGVGSRATIKQLRNQVSRKCA